MPEPGGTWPGLRSRPRQAAVEKQPQRPWPSPQVPEEMVILPGFPGGAELLGALEDGGAPRAFWQVPCVASTPGDLVGGVIEAVAATVRAGRGALVLFPTSRGMETAATRLEQCLGQGSVARLNSDLSRLCATKLPCLLARQQGWPSEPSQLPSHPCGTWG